MRSQEDENISTIKKAGRCKEQANWLSAPTSVGRSINRGKAPEGIFRCHHRISVSELPAPFTEQKRERVPERAQDYSTPRRWQWSESNGNMSEGFVPRSVHEKKLIFGVRRGNDDYVHLLSSLSSLSFVSAAVKANDDATKPIIPRGGVVMHDRLAFAF